MNTDLPDETEAPSPEPRFSGPSARLYWLLRHRHDKRAGEWAVFTEFPVGQRFLDVFAVNTWQSSAYRSVAYEIKVSRADFDREIRDPDKRLAAENLADECFFVVPAGLLRPDEVPEGWGLIVATANGLKVVKKAMQRQPAPWPRSVSAMIARRSADPPPPPHPGALWAHAGREVTAEELTELCRGVLPGVVAQAVAEQIASLREQERAAAMREIRRDVLHAENHVLSVLADFMGKRPHQITADGVRDWLAARAGGLSRSTLRDLRAAHRALGRLVETAEPADPVDR